MDTYISTVRNTCQHDRIISTHKRQAYRGWYEDSEGVAIYTNEGDELEIGFILPQDEPNDYRDSRSEAIYY
jgi:hypothetical protein